MRRWWCPPRPAPGDAVGLLASGGERRWVAPQRGMGAIDVFLRETTALQPTPVATDYLAAATELSLRHRRRSLVMLVTNLRDEDMEDLLAAVRMLQQRHHVVVASLREESLAGALDGPAQDLPGRCVPRPPRVTSRNAPPRTTRCARIASGCWT